MIDVKKSDRAPCQFQFLDAKISICEGPSDPVQVRIRKRPVTSNWNARTKRRVAVEPVLRLREAPGALPPTGSGGKIWASSVAEKKARPAAGSRSLKSFSNHEALFVLVRESKEPLGTNRPAPIGSPPRPSMMKAHISPAKRT